MTQAGGVLVVDKPSGLTSHDVVQRVRRALGIRSVGHAGTLDPMATGVLVVAVGEGTKLAGYLAGDDKEYEAEVTLGAVTDTLDADGTVVRSAPVPADLSDALVGSAMRAFEGPIRQRAPEVSAIKVGGRRLHARVRRGEKVLAPVREVHVRSLALLGIEGSRIRLRVRCGKGFYVRSLARDLAEALGTVGHLSMLRRTASGPFTLRDSVPYDLVDRAAGEGGAPRQELATHIRSLEEAASGLPRVVLSEAGVDHARHGRPIDVDGTALRALPEVAEDATLALFDPVGRLVALGRRSGGGLRVVRGIHPVAPRPA